MSRSTTWAHSWPCRSCRGLIEAVGWPCVRSACPGAWGCRCGACTCMGAWSSRDKRQLGHVRCSWTLQVEGDVNSAMVAWCKLEG